MADEAAFLFVILGIPTAIVIGILRGMNRVRKAVYGEHVDIASVDTFHIYRPSELRNRISQAYPDLPAIRAGVDALLSDSTVAFEATIPAGGEQRHPTFMECRRVVRGPGSTLVPVKAVGGARSRAFDSAPSVVPASSIPAVASHHLPPVTTANPASASSLHTRDTARAVPPDAAPPSDVPHKTDAPTPTQQPPSAVAPHDELASSKGLEVVPLLLDPFALVECRSKCRAPLHPV